jgi:hypothetical protein
MSGREPDASWQYFTATRRGLSNTCQHCPKAPYLSLTLPGSSGSNTPLRVRRIVFTTTSHDQGYSGDPERQGTYLHSHTFFDVHVVEPSGHDRVPPRALQFNVHAGRAYKTHINCWDYRDVEYGADGDPSSALLWQNLGLSLQDWLQSIRSGDSVQIVPMAKFPGWNNFVLEACVEVWAEPATSNGPSLLAISTYLNNDYSSYRPLDAESKEVRLVVIEPAAGDGEGGGVDSPLRLSLQYTALDDPNHVPYEALSYTWGTEFDPRPVYVTSPGSADVEWSVNKNLFWALRRLRLADRHRTMWIDLLSINQTDLAERGQQVSIMGNVFAAAESVQVWLGELDECVGNDLDVMTAIAEQYCGGDGVAASPPSLPDPRTTHRIIADHHDAGQGSDDIPFYQMHHTRVFRRPWFQRVWVLQEVWGSAAGEAPSGRVQVRCGERVLPWEVLLQANHCFRAEDRLQTNSTIPAIWLALFHLERRSSPLTCRPALRRDILSVFLAGLELRATDARDKIFALLVFGHETYRVSELPALIRPDYTKSTVQVYADFTRWWIQSYRSLDILSAVHTLHGRTWAGLSGSDLSPPPGSSVSQSEAPSWALGPDGRGAWRDATLALRATACPYSASGRNEVDLDLLSPANMTTTQQAAGCFTLVLRGRRVTTVTAISYYPYYQQQHSVAPLSCGIGEAYNALFAPTGVKGRWESSDSGESLGALARRAQEHEGAAIDHGYAHWNQEALVSEDGHDGDTEPATYLPCHGKCMLQTASGAIGLSPQSAQVGDTVAILFGGKVPYLLRPAASQPQQVGHCYFFVGECYVEGLMHGDGVHLNDGPADDEIFQLI